MTYEQLKAAMEQANLEGKFDPGTYPVDEDLIKWLIETFYVTFKN